MHPPLAVPSIPLRPHVCAYKRVFAWSVGRSYHNSLFWPYTPLPTRAQAIPHRCTALSFQPVLPVESWQRVHIHMADCMHMAEMIVVTYMCTSLVQARSDKRNNSGSVTKSDVTDYPALAAGHNCGGTERGSRSPERRKSKLTAPSSLCSGSGPVTTRASSCFDTRALVLRLRHRAIIRAAPPRPLCAVRQVHTAILLCFYQTASH